MISNNKNIIKMTCERSRDIPLPRGVGFIKLFILIDIGEMILSTNR